MAAEVVKIIQGVALVARPIDSLRKIRERLRKHPLLLGLLGGEMTPAEFAAVAKVYRELLPGNIQLRFISRSLEHRIGVKISQETLAEDAWLLTGNYDSLRRGVTVRPWLAQQSPEWVPLQVVETVMHRTQSNKVGAVFYLRALAGSPAGQLFETFRTTKFCRWLARDLGFTRDEGRRPFRRIDEMVNLRLYALLLPNDRGPQPLFDKFCVTSAFQSHNIKLLKVRNREFEACPKRYQHDCHACPLGYDRCQYATHPLTYVKAECGVCKRPDAITDPRRVQLGICVRCHLSRKLAKRE